MLTQMPHPEDTVFVFTPPNKDVSHKQSVCNYITSVSLPKRPDLSMTESLRF